MIELVKSEVTRPFPVIVQRTVFDGVTDLNKELLELVNRILSSYPIVSDLSYIATEKALQADCNILLDFYGKESCITQLMDEIITPSVESWTNQHFLELTGKPKPMGAKFNLVSWATLYEPGSWQTPHIHRDKMFTGVYYVKMCEQNESVSDDGALCTNGVQVHPSEMRAEGSLVLQNPHLQSSQPLLGGWQTHKELLPVEGELIIFPSWVSHFPKPFSKGTRCVIVFDAQYVG